MSKTTEELIEEVSQNAIKVGIHRERLRILEIIVGLGIPCIPIATVRRLLEDTNNE